MAVVDGESTVFLLSVQTVSLGAQSVESIGRCNSLTTDPFSRPRSRSSLFFFSFFLFGFVFLFYSYSFMYLFPRRLLPSRLAPLLAHIRPFWGSRVGEFLFDGFLLFFSVLFFFGFGSVLPSFYRVFNVLQRTPRRFNNSL